MCPSIDIPSLQVPPSNLGSVEQPEFHYRFSTDGMLIASANLVDFFIPLPTCRLYLHRTISLDIYVFAYLWVQKLFPQHHSLTGTIYLIFLNLYQL